MLVTLATLTILAILEMILSFTLLSARKKQVLWQAKVLLRGRREQLAKRLGLPL